MPYIISETRFGLDPTVRVAFERAAGAGDLNFQITRLVDDWLKARRPEWKYADINTAIGALECAKLELYRRVAAPYENAKLAEHGDVYR